jgi:hypothetical protein
VRESRREKDVRSTYPQINVEYMSVQVSCGSHVDEENVDHSKDTQILASRLTTKTFAEKNLQAENVTNRAKHHQTWIENTNEAETDCTVPHAGL